MVLRVNTSPAKCYKWLLRATGESFSSESQMQVTFLPDEPLILSNNDLELVVSLFYYYTSSQQPALFVLMYRLSC